MSAKRRCTKRVDASDLTPQPSDNPAPIDPYNSECRAITLACDAWNSHELAASTTAEFDEVDRLARYNQFHPDTATLSLQDLHSIADSKLPVLQLLQGAGPYLSPQCEPVFDLLGVAGTWSGSTCAGRPDYWSTTTCVPRSENWDDLADRIIDDTPTLNSQDHQSGNDSTSGWSSSKSSRTQIPTKLNVDIQSSVSSHHNPWLKLSEPWSPYNLRSENHGHSAILDSVLRRIPTLKNGITPQKGKTDRMGHTIMPAFLLPGLDRQQSHMSDRFLQMLAALDPLLNPGRANSFFNGLDILVGDLRDRFPNDSVVMGLVRALEHLELFYLLNFVKAPTRLNQWSGANTDAEEGTDSRAAMDESPSFRGSLHYSLNSATAPQYGKNPNDGNLTSNDTAGNDGPRLSGKPRKKLQKMGRRLACPIRKHQEVHSQPLKCGFDGAANMWEVTQHLKRQVHRNFLPFLVLCRHCWIYVTDQDEYRSVHKDSLCGVNSQPRGPRVSEHWQKLYRSIYPGSDTVPSPWIDERQQQNAMLSGLHNTTTPSEALQRDVGPSHNLSFLADEPTGGNGPVTPTVPQTSIPRAIPSTEHQAEMAALDLFNMMFQDSFRRPGDLGEYYLNNLVVGQASQLPSGQIHQFADRFRERANDIVNMLQLQAENTTLPTDTAPILPTSSSDTSKTRGRQAQGQNDMSTPLVHSDTWLGEFPVPEQMRIEPFEIATPAQQGYPEDFFNIGDWLIDGSPDGPPSALPPSLHSTVAS